jgi:alpha-beta hydrolase superfamily lysophospholipase
MVRGVRWRLAGLLICVVVGACATTEAVETRQLEPLDYTRAMPAIASEAWSARGTLLSSSDHPAFDVDALPAGSAAYTMLYRSISGITGAPTEVSGAVFTPPGNPPDGGWPVIGYGHGTVGVTSECGPTGDPRLFGDIKAVAIQLTLGYAVVFTDYAGLGKTSQTAPLKQSHAYLEPKSAAFNLIDAVRAARVVVPQLSSRWVALGASQGGAAAWAAAEYDAGYGQGTDLLGAAAIVPTLDLSGLVQRAQDAKLTVEQLYLYPYIVTGLAAVDPAVHPDDYLHGTLRDNQNLLLSCGSDAAQRKEQLATALSAADATPSSASAADRLRRRLAAYALPQQPTKIPILAVYGGADDTVAPEWTEVAMGRACALGDTVLRARIEGQGHTLDPGALLGQWVADRFAGVQAKGNC